MAGGFWKGYEKRAYLFTRDIRPYQVKKKYIKSVGREICSIGAENKIISVTE
jgi:hypothetical protein